MIKGEFLYKKRIDAGLSQSQVANELGYSVQLISLWESGKNTPSITVLAKYASLLNVDLEGIIYSKDIKNNTHCETNIFNLNEFSKNLKKLRKKKGITQKDLANEISCPTNAIIRFEKASSVPSIEQLIKLADYFNISLDDLYFATSFAAPIIPHVKKTKIPIPIFLPIVITVAVGGGATGAVIGITNLTAKKAVQENELVNQPNVENETIIDSSEPDTTITDQEEGQTNNESEPTDSNINDNTNNELTNPSIPDEPSGDTTEPSKYLYFGSYPQTRINDAEIIASLNSISEPNSSGYYEYLDEEYLKINAFYNSLYSSSIDAGFYFDNGERIVDGEEYWFKVEPIKWQILEEDDNQYFLVSSLAIDARIFDEDSSNYENSAIREWLNDEFLNTAFRGVKDDLILMNIDNSLSSTGTSTNPYTSNNTSDYVSLLSNSEAKNKTYAVELITYTTEYLRASGGFANGDKKSSYWLRSPDYQSQVSVQTVNTVGKIYVSNDCYRDSIGVRPIITIKK